MRASTQFLGITVPKKRKQINSHWNCHEPVIIIKSVFNGFFADHCSGMEICNPDKDGEKL